MDTQHQKATKDHSTSPSGLGTFFSGEIEVLCVSASVGDPNAISDAIDSYRAVEPRVIAHLNKSGAVLFRGFAITDAPTLRRFASETSDGLWGYVNGNSPRTKLGDGIYTASEYPPHLPISLHNELSYSATWPGRIYFSCPQPAAVGGMACMADSRTIFDCMPESVIDLFEEHGGVRYVRVLPGSPGFGATWQQTFDTEDLSEVRRFCQENENLLEILDNGYIRVSNVTPAYRVDPESGRRIWFNQADQFHPSGLPADTYEALLDIYDGNETLFPQNASFGDGTAFPLELLADIRSIQESCQRTFPWEANDVLILNNSLVAHGRLPFEGPRQLYVALTR